MTASISASQRTSGRDQFHRLYEQDLFRRCVAGSTRLVPMEFVLVHSPLVGPATWRWVAEALSAAGHGVVVPDLRSAAVAGGPEVFIAAGASAVPSVWVKPVLVGHSGAGFFLPSIGAGVDAVQLVFVDAGVPPRKGPATAGGDFLAQLRSMAVGGVLPRWSTWWGGTVMRTLVPDDVRRAVVEAELPEVPLAFYESAVELPAGWDEGRGAYVLLSEAYRDDAARARFLGWPLIERLGGHLDIVSDPGAIARAVIEATH